jgi:uncharacterized protein (DUF305 family)
MLSIRGGIAALSALLAAVVIGACGEDEQPRSSSDAAGNSTDRAFVVQMIPHHKSAVEMAAVAKKRARHSALKRLANSIIATQSIEIEQLRRYDDRLEKAGVEPGELGAAHEDMGGGMDADSLMAARPFDREFIDGMIAHHQGAIHMARAQLDTGENHDLKRLAEAIVDAQSKEIDQMNTWRIGWYGSLSPAGGVPAEDSPHHGM